MGYEELWPYNNGGAGRLPGGPALTWAHDYNNKSRVRGPEDEGPGIGRGAPREGPAGVGRAGRLAAPQGLAAYRSAGRRQTLGIGSISTQPHGGGPCSHSLGRAAGRDGAAQRNGTDSRWPKEQFMW